MSVQLIIILFYLLLTIAIGLLSRFRQKTSSSFHGAGLGVILCVAAGAGEWLGGTSTTGVSEYGYMFGISGAWYTIANSIGILILALFFAKLYRSLGQITIPGILGKYLGSNARIVSSILLTFVMITIGTVQLIAAGTLGVSVLNLSFESSVFILGFCFIIYTLMGGMRAVALTNMLHLFMHYFGIILALFIVGKKSGDLHSLAASLPDPAYFSWFGIGKAKVFSWLIASALGACTAQAGIQPILAARDIHVAKKSALITCLVVAPYGILTALLGMYAKIQFPNLSNAKLAIPSLMMSLSPIAGGIVLASIMSAVLSTISPVILAAGTLMTKDIYQSVIRPEASDKQVLFCSRFITGAAGGVCMILAILFYNSTTILDMVYFAYTIRGAIFMILLFGMYGRKMSNQGAVWAMLSTLAVSLAWVVYHSVSGVYPIVEGFTETYASVVAAALFSILFSVVMPRNQVRLPAIAEESRENAAE